MKVCTPGCSSCAEPLTVSLPSVPAATTMRLAAPTRMKGVVDGTQPLNSKVGELKTCTPGVSMSMPTPPLMTCAMAPAGMKMRCMEPTKR